MVVACVGNALSVVVALQKRVGRPSWWLSLLLLLLLDISSWMRTDLGFS